MTKISEKALWFKELSGDKPLVIAGPCSAETPQEVLDIAHKYKSKVPIYHDRISCITKKYVFFCNKICFVLSCIG